ncbi:hypothetical protein I4U23_013902 [Adineta vaga]|nr:hypothetical protein I4U23_013902 [Adineta vaga]
MTDQFYHTIANSEYENLPETDATNNLDNDFKSYMEILIAEHIGYISKSYRIEHQRLSSYAYYPPMNEEQIRVLTIGNITSNEIKHQLSEKIYKQLETTFEKKMVQWNSIVQTTAKRFVTNSVEQAIDTFREKLSEIFQDEENQTNNIIVQRFILVNNELKLI